MPRPTRKTSNATALVVSPWRRVQRNRTQPRQNRAPTPETRDEDTVSYSLDIEQLEGLRPGLEAFVRRLELPNEALAEVASTERESWSGGIGILAFEGSGGNFIGMMLDDVARRPRLRFAGYKRTASVPDCRYNDAQELYELNIHSEHGRDAHKRLYVCNRGGDQARFDTEDSLQSSSLKVSFRCVELYGNTSEASLLSPFFRDPDVVVNVGVMWISEWPIETADTC